VPNGPAAAAIAGRFARWAAPWRRPRRGITGRRVHERGIEDAIIQLRDLMDERKHRPETRGS
jgi:hypothetical protein